jgi:hypothetical protein
MNRSLNIAAMTAARPGDASAKVRELMLENSLPARVDLDV